MKKYLLIAILAVFSSQFAHAQELVLHKDFPGVTWPFLWDMEQDTDGNFYVCSEQGILYIKKDGVWEEHDLNPSSTADARGIAIGDNGTVWVATEDGLYAFDGANNISHFTSNNSDLPSDDLREIRFHDGKLWINLNGDGIAIKEGNAFTHLTSSNSALESDDIEDIEISSSGLVVITASVYLHFVSGNDWTTYNFGDMFNTVISDIYIDHNEDLWFGTRKGVVKYNTTNDEFEDLKSEYGQRNYSAIIYTPENELWLGELFEGLHWFDDQGNNAYFEGNQEGQPSQVFDFIYYQDTVRVVGNIGATTTGLTVDGVTPIVERPKDLFSFHPNPARDYLKVDVKNIEDFMITIRSAAGQVLSQSRNVDLIDLSRFGTGNYILELVDTKTKNTAIQKFVIVK